MFFPKMFIDWYVWLCDFTWTSILSSSVFLEFFILDIYQFNVYDLLCPNTCLLEKLPRVLVFYLTRSYGELGRMMSLFQWYCLAL